MVKGAKGAFGEAVPDFNLKDLDYAEMFSLFVQQTSQSFKDWTFINPHSIEEYSGYGFSVASHFKGHDFMPTEIMNAYLGSIGFYPVASYVLEGVEDKYDREKIEQVFCLEPNSKLEVAAHPCGFIASFVSEPGYISYHLRKNAGLLGRFISAEPWHEDTGIPGENKQGIAKSST